LCIATRGARQTLADFLAEYEPRLGGDPWVSLACIADNRLLSPMARMQARTVLATVEEMCPVRRDRLGRPLLLDSRHDPHARAVHSTDV
jgi:hypothetical protein